YPRKEKKKVDKSGENPKAITCTYEIEDWLLTEISDDIGKDVLKNTSFTLTTKYNGGGRTIGNLTADKKKFIEFKTKELGVASNALTEKLLKVTTAKEFDELATTYKDENYVEAFKS